MCCLLDYFTGTLHFHHKIDLTMVAASLALINSLVVWLGIASVHYQLNFEEDKLISDFIESSTRYFVSCNSATKRTITWNSLVILQDMWESNLLSLDLLMQYGVWILANMELSHKEIEELPLNLESNFISINGASNDSIDLYEWFRVKRGPLMRNKIATWTQSQSNGGELQAIDKRSRWKRRSDFGGVVLKNGMRMKSQVTFDRDNIMWHMQKVSEGNYEERGILADVMQTLQNRLNFSTEIVFGPDDKYGTINPDGSWNGIVGQLQKHSIDLSTAGLTTTADRSHASDFTLGIIPDLSTLSARTSNHKLQTLNIWAFINVFPAAVWLLILVAMLLTAILYWTYLRNSKAKDHIGGFNAGLAFTYLVLLQLDFPGSSHNILKQPSGRVFVISVSFFAMALFAHYAGDLTAFMTVRKTKAHVNSFQVNTIILLVKFKLVLGQSVILILGSFG